MLANLVNLLTALFCVYFFREFWKRTSFTGEGRWVWALLCALSFVLLTKALSFGLAMLVGLFLPVGTDGFFMGVVLATIAGLGLSVVGMMMLLDRVLSPSIKSATQ